MLKITFWNNAAVLGKDKPIFLSHPLSSPLSLIRGFLSSGNLCTDYKKGRIFATWITTVKSKNAALWLKQPKTANVTNVVTWCGTIIIVLFFEWFFFLSNCFKNLLYKVIKKQSEKSGIMFVFKCSYRNVCFSLL